MNPLRQYKIGFVGLSVGKHRFSFDIDPGFFLSFGESAFEIGSVHLDLVLHKSNNLMELDFSFSGDVELTCDRCSGVFPYRVDFQKRLLVKFGEQYLEQSDEIMIIPATESHFDIAQYVYEFLHLGIPVRKVHEEGTEGQGCDPEVIRKLEQFLHRAHAKDDGSPWDVLRSLNFEG